MDVFEGFSDADFQAYSQEQWASNAFNRHRQAVKEKLRRLGLVLQKITPALAGASLGSSPENPSQWNGRQVRDQWLFVLQGTPEERRDAERIADQERPLSLLL